MVANDDLLDNSDREKSGENSIGRLQAEWLTLNAVREVVGIGQKQTPTYLDALGVGIDIAPELFLEIPFFLAEREGTWVRLYKQKARSMSEMLGKEVSPLDAIDREIEEYEDLLRSPERTREINELYRHLNRLRITREQLAEANYSETMCILRDARDYYDSKGLDIIDMGKTYRDYHVSRDRALRVRILHPDKPEHVLGADVVYESHWPAKKMARIVMIQYKMWNGRVLYSSQSNNLINQLDNLTGSLCSRGYCKAFARSKRIDAYRLPFCSAFLRPTDRIQSTNHARKSSGYHIPVCVVARLWIPTGKVNAKLERRIFRGESVTQGVFEEMFNSGMLGSRWLTFDELSALYKKTDILSNTKAIRIYAQEYGGAPSQV